MEFSFFDIILLVLLLYFSLNGLVEGFFEEIFGLAGLVAGLWLAHTYHGELVPYLTFLDVSLWRVIFAYIVIFVVVNVLAKVMAGGMKALLSLAMIPWADKLAGFLLGLGKGVVLCSFLTLIVQKFFGDVDFLQNSSILPYMNTFVESVRAHIPQEFFTISL